MRRDIRLRQLKPKSSSAPKTSEKTPQKPAPVKKPFTRRPRTQTSRPSSYQKKPVESVKIKKVRKTFKKFLPKRPLDANKWDFGHVLVFAGSQRMAGAGILTSRAALRMGSGLVTAGIPYSLNTIFKISVPEALTVPLPQTPDGAIGKEAIKVMQNYIHKYSSIALGPGLSRNQQTQSFVLQIIERLNKPCVIDADALYALNGNLHFLTRKNIPIVVTPHKVEMSRLMHCRVEDVMENREQSAADFAHKYNVICVLKGHKTIVANPDGSVYINSTGNPGMATAGSGDVLTGMIACLLGQELDPFDAVCFAVYLHGLCGDLAVKDKTETCIIASDLIKYLPLAVKSVR